MNLIEPVELMPVDQLGPVHFIAVGGSGMCGIARIYDELGVSVSGSDQDNSTYFESLSDTGVKAFLGHNPEHLGDAETVVISTAVRETNVELAEARKRGLRVWHRSAALGALMLGKRGIGVSGTNGKSTTTAIIASMLLSAGQDPSYYIGSILPVTGVSAALGTGEAFVIEADESDGSFMQYPLEILVITNVLSDHLDNWDTPENYYEGYQRWVRQSGVKTVILCIDDPGNKKLAKTAKAAGKKVITYGLSEQAEIRCTNFIVDDAGNSMTLVAPDDIGKVSVQIPGKHVLLNCAAAYAVARELGISGALAREALGTYAGLYRRLQYVDTVNDIQLMMDYGHMPNEIMASLAAVKPLAKRLVVAFQSVTYSRTRDYYRELAAALAAADVILCTDIYGQQREDPIPGVTGELIYNVARELFPDKPVFYIPDLELLPEKLAELLIPGDLFMAQGAGDIDRYLPKIIEALR